MLCVLSGGLHLLGLAVYAKAAWVLWQRACWQIHEPRERAAVALAP
jgi:hypothetical protein